MLKLEGRLPKKIHSPNFLLGLGFGETAPTKVSWLISGRAPVHAAHGGRFPTLFVISAESSVLRGLSWSCSLISIYEDRGLDFSGSLQLSQTLSDVLINGRIIGRLLQ